MANKIVHVEVVGKDGARLQQFFSDLFGWKFNTDNPGGYGLFDADQTGVGGGIGASPDGSPGHVSFYVSVPDIDAALKKAERFGGRTLMPAMSPAPGTTIALFADPEGHVIGLSQGD